MIDSLPRREREISEILCSAGEATVAGIRAAMTDPPSYSAVRTLTAHPRSASNCWTTTALPSASR